MAAPLKRPQPLDDIHTLPPVADQPIRSTYFHEENLRRLGSELARQQRLAIVDLDFLDFKERQRDNARRIAVVHRAVNAAQTAGESVTPAAQWLLDNYYLVAEAIQQVKRDLPPRFFGELPTVELENGQRVPRVLAIAWAYVAHTDSAVAPETLKALVDGYQTVQILKIGELWALPSLLRFVLIENLRRLAMRVNRGRIMRHIANDVADQLALAESRGGPEPDLSAYADHARDTAFATQLLFRLRDGSKSAGHALYWLECECERHGTNAEAIIAAEHQTLSSGNVTVGNIIRGLRRIDDQDWSEWFEEVSRVDALLRRAGNYSELEFHSRDQYRAAIEDLARRSGLSEDVVTERVVEMARGKSPEARRPANENTPPPGPDTADVGFFLVGPQRQDFERSIGYRPRWHQRLMRHYRRTGWVGLAVPIALLSVLFLWLADVALDGVGLSQTATVALLLLFAIPAIEGAVGLFNTIALMFVRPTRLIGYEFREGVPAHARTLVVMPVLIGSRADVDECVRNLEVHHLANTSGELYFAVLSDWPDSDEEQTEADLELLAYAREQIGGLNGRYPAGDVAARFHLLHRGRLYNEQEGRWMGWERKRGKLHELNQLLRGDGQTTFLPSDTPLPTDVVFVVTLDADTRMTRDAAVRLAGKLAHPLNLPVSDPKTGVVQQGYGILQPRVTPSLTTGDEASFFQRVFSSNRGLDPYVFAVSDLYQDVFGEGTFTGKGIYHVDAFEAALRGRVPENTVLSHDLLEGAFARAALASDIELVEDYPTSYAVDASRNHRWARGDWQLLPFILDLGAGFSGLSRWKMLDNLRRTLTPIFWVAAAIAGWTLLPFAEAVEWLMLLTIALFVAPTFNVVDAIVPKTISTTFRGHLAALWRDFAFGSALVVLRVNFVAHWAWMMADAVLRTLYRLVFSRRNLLEWRTSSQATRTLQGDVAAYYRFMWGSPVIAAVAIALPLLNGSSGVLIAAVFTVFWTGAPAFAWFVSRSAAAEDGLTFTEQERLKLRDAARRTWLYFEHFVTAEHHMLPPDNFQESPAQVVASRTSPTNIGMYLLSTVSARDFGWISLSETVDRIAETLLTVERLERHRGHLYNWYDTRRLAPLKPLYISSVDSGNLAGHLLAVSSAFEEWAEAPSAYLQGDYNGILDTLAVLEQCLADLPDDRRPLRPLRKRLEDRIRGVRNAALTLLAEPETAAFRMLNLAVLAGDVRRLAIALHNETRTQPSAVLADWAERLVAVCEAHVADAHTDTAAVEQLRSRLRDTARRARTLAFEMDFSFLLQRKRMLLSIGYRVHDHQLDESCYDLLASEARLASLFAIAKGDIPTEHWFRLGRPIVEIGFRGALLSWAGSMFEYLMPPLVMNEPHGGILAQTNRLIIRRQIDYARARRLPWGISEAAYNARDRELTYQYTNFGVPGLGLKRGLGLNTVVAPYATLLASQFAPKEACANLARLEQLGALGRFGYYDAIDFTPSRVPEGKESVVVRNYMAHHQGMSIVAAGNVVHEGKMRDRFHADPVIEAAELLLQEKAPRNIPVASVRADIKARAEEPHAIEGPDIRDIVDPANAPKAIALMSGGRYSLMVTATGSGYSRFDGLAVTRWHPDPVEDRSGTFLFIRDTETGDCWSATAEPRYFPGESAQTILADDKATFIKTVGKLRSEVECIAAGEAFGEGRRITLINEGLADRFVEVTSYAELVLGLESADNAHPAFSKMFIETRIDRERPAIFARRRGRSPGDREICAAHFISGNSAQAGEFEAETCRRAFIGRGRTLPDAAAFDPARSLSGRDGFTLDPIFALRQRLRVPANRKVSVTFWTVAGDNPAEVEAAIARLDFPESFERQSMLAWTQSQVQTRYCGLSLADAASVQKLARYLVYPDHALRSAPDSIASGLGSQSGLWPLGISGDFPILALRISDQSDLPLVGHALRMHELMRARGLIADFVVVNEQASSYVQDLQVAIDAICENARLRGDEHGPRVHIFAVRRDLMDPSTYQTLLAVARVVLHTRNGKVEDQMDRAEATRRKERRAERLLEIGQKQTTVGGSAVKEAGASGNAGRDLQFWNGFGGFSHDAREYVVRLEGGRRTPHPWVNVIANPDFGFHVSAEGAAFTWSRNSRDFQLTPWSNDPVVNRPGEGLYVRDSETGAMLSPFAALVPHPTAHYEARHGHGFSTFTALADDLALEATMLVDSKDPVRVTRLTIRNRGLQPRKLRIFAYAEWVLADNRWKSAPTIVPARDQTTGALLARNPYSLEYSDRVAFLASDAQPDAWTTDRMEFIGHHGSVVRPAMLNLGLEPSGLVAAGHDPCALIARDIEVAPNGEITTLWLLGDAASDEEARGLVLAHAPLDFDERLAKNDQAWKDIFGTLQVNTPDAALDAMVNGWLPYQALACRIRARAAFYQASGAFGFRDQLQDTLSLLLHDPTLARTQILNAASRQFPEGDVQHWWLPRTGAGVRTMISDDVVWLAYGVAHYLASTGDATILAEETPFILGDPLERGQHDAFFTPRVSDEKGTIYEHCARALDLAVQRRSSNGLPLILGGDWNDGMNRVGEKGQGESVWLGWFLLKTLHDFAPVAKERGDTKRASRWLAHARQLKNALEATGWDGEWYRRGSFDDGSPLGSRHSDECRIDSIAQSWSVLSGHGDPQRSETAMNAAMRLLVDKDREIVRLFTPPFEKTDKEPGYIKSYPPGVRENGGQYTHAAAWFALALAEMGRTDDSLTALRMLLPVNHALDAAAAERYRVEPYVIAADIYSEADRAGRGGWTWYTGSAGWVYRAAIEGILGIRRRADHIVLRPALPTSWPGFSAKLRIGGAAYSIEVSRNARQATSSATLDGQPVAMQDGSEAIVPIAGDGEHVVTFVVGSARKRAR